MQDNPLTFLATTATPSIEIPVEALGSPGIQGELHVLAQIPGERRSDLDRLNDMSSRAFKVYAQLSKLPPTTGSISADFTEKTGSSYFLVPPNFAMHRVDTSFGSFHIRKNDNGEMSLVEFECVSTDVASAHKQFANAVLPFLDHLSYVANSPIYVLTIRVEDPTNHRTSFNFTSPYRPAVVENHAERLFLEMKPIYSMYREARNASSGFYRFLCFYKILEGLLGKMRADARKRATAQGVELRASRELVPDSAEYSSSLRPYVGKSIKKFFDEVLTPKFRNAVAHFVTDDGTVLQMSDPDHLNQFANIMLVSELCVRTVIAAHEEMLSQMAG